MTAVRTDAGKWKKVWNILFLLVVFLATLWSVFHGEDISRVFSYLMTADRTCLVLSFCCVLLFILGEAVVICYLMRCLGTEIQFFHCCLYSFIGFFYSCITPSASGGQPMQVVAMRRDRIPVAVSSVVLAIVTITYKMVLVLIGTAVILVHPASVMCCLELVKSLVILGIFLNVICITVLLLLVFDPNAVYRIMKAVLSVMNRIRPLKHPERQEKKLD